MTMDTATLIKPHCAIANTSAKLSASYSCEPQWREWYYYVVRRLQSEGIKTPEDIEVGADEYVSLRREWNDEVAAFAKHMAYRWLDVAPAETNLKVHLK